MKKKVKRKRIKAFAAVGDSDGIYAPGNINTLCVYEKFEYGLLDGFSKTELMPCTITYELPETPKRKARR